MEYAPKDPQQQKNPRRAQPCPTQTQQVKYASKRPALKIHDEPSPAQPAQMRAARQSKTRWRNVTPRKKRTSLQPDAWDAPRHAPGRAQLDGAQLDQYKLQESPSLAYMHAWISSQTLLLYGKTRAAGERNSATRIFSAHSNGTPRFSLPWRCIEISNFIIAFFCLSICRISYRTLRDIDMSNFDINRFDISKYRISISFLVDVKISGFDIEGFDIFQVSDFDIESFDVSNTGFRCRTFRDNEILHYDIEISNFDSALYRIEDVSPVISWYLP